MIVHLNIMRNQFQVNEVFGPTVVPVGYIMYLACAAPTPMMRKWVFMLIAGNLCCCLIKLHFNSFNVALYSASGSYFLETASSTPFALGAYNKSTLLLQRQLPLLYDYKDIGDDDFEPQLRKGFTDWTENDFLEFGKSIRFN